MGTTVNSRHHVLYFERFEIEVECPAQGMGVSMMVFMISVSPKDGEHNRFYKLVWLKISIMQ